AAGVHAGHGRPEVPGRPGPVPREQDARRPGRGRAGELQGPEDPGGDRRAVRRRVRQRRDLHHRMTEEEKNVAMTRDEETALAKELAEELGLNLPLAAQVGFQYDVEAARKKAEELREMARGRDREAADSFDRCDTDGALSQWASGINAQKYRLQADIAENGGMWEFPALFD